MASALVDVSVAGEIDPGSNPVAVDVKCCHGPVDGKVVHEIPGWMYICIGQFASGTLGDHVLTILVHSGPEESHSDPNDCLRKTKVSSNGICMECDKNDVPQISRYNSQVPTGLFAVSRLFEQKHASL